MTLARHGGFTVHVLFRSVCVVSTLSQMRSIAAAEPTFSMAPYLAYEHSFDSAGTSGAKKPVTPIRMTLLTSGRRPVKNTCGREGSAGADRMAVWRREGRTEGGLEIFRPGAPRHLDYR